MLSTSVTLIVSAPMLLIKYSLTGEMCGSIIQINLYPKYLHVAASAIPMFPEEDSIIVVSLLIVPSLYNLFKTYIADLSLELPKAFAPSYFK